MIDSHVFSMLAGNLFYGFAAFMAIVVWVKTRESSWIFIVLAVLGFYAAEVYGTLLFFGILLPEIYMLYGIDVVQAAFDYVPAVFLITALAIKAVKNMGR